MRAWWWCLGGWCQVWLWVSPGVIHPDNIFLLIFSHPVISGFIILEWLVQVSRYSQCVAKVYSLGLTALFALNKDIRTFILSLHFDSFHVFGEFLPGYDSFAITRWNSSKIPFNSSTYSAHSPYFSLFEGVSASRVSLLMTRSWHSPIAENHSQQNIDC